MSSCDLIFKFEQETDNLSVFCSNLNIKSQDDKFRSLFYWIINSKIFYGIGKLTFLSCSALCHVNDYYLSAGGIIVLSVVHDGPAIKCLSTIP